jgi:long-chain acyl-CoA synthetase
MVSVWAQQKNLPFTTQRDLIEKPEVRKLIESAVNEVNREVDEEEQIQGFELLPIDLEETGALTATQKVRRGMAVAQFSDLIERMYAA